MQRIVIDPEPVPYIAAKDIHRSDIIAFKESGQVFILTVKDSHFDDEALTTGTWFWTDLRCWNSYDLYPKNSAIEAIEYMLQYDRIIYRFESKEEFAQWILTLNH